MTEELEFHVEGPRAVITLNRPQARNALTWKMYDGLARACDRVDGDEQIRVAVVRGAGGSFAAGTDIRQFAEFRTAEDGLAYEARISAVVERLESVRVPTIAVVEGPAVGGGLVLACACDLRLAAGGAVFGVPVARTLGNCLSGATLARLAFLIGGARALELVYSARLLTAPEASSWGLVTECFDAGDVETRLDAWCETLVRNAPLTMWAAKEFLRRMRVAELPSSADLVARCYGSTDFHEGVAAFVEKRKPRWTGR